LDEKDSNGSRRSIGWLAAAGLNLPRPSDKPKRGRQIQQLKLKKKRNPKNEGKEELYSGIQAWEIRDLHGILSITSI
jgi:hypothetical protein